MFMSCFSEDDRGYKLRLPVTSPPTNSPPRNQLATKRSLQYKLLSRCLVTNAFLFKVGLASTPACSFCGEMEESLEHLITSCHYSENFWAEVIKWFDKQGIKFANFSDKDVMYW